MKELFLGEYIKKKRLEMGITQEELSEGICEPITISRLENGKQMPSYNRIRALLQRLGLPDDRFYALLSKNEVEMKTLEDELNADVVRLERAVPEEVSKISQDGLLKLKRLEELAEPDDAITRQLILSEKSIFGRPDGPYTPQEQLNMLLEAIRITCPSFDIEEINLGLYSLDETTIINQIANAYARIGDRKTAISIFDQLLKYLKKHYKSMSRYSGKYTLIAKNYAINLYRVKRYDDAAEAAQLGLNVCAEYGHYQFLPAFIHILGECSYQNGDIEKCREHFKSAWYIYKALGNDRDRLRLEDSIKAYFGDDFLL